MAHFSFIPHGLMVYGATSVNKSEIILSIKYREINISLYFFIWRCLVKCRKCPKDVFANGLCGSCNGKEWYIKNKESVKKRKANKYKANSEREIARVKKWRKANPELVRKMDANRDMVKNAAYYKNRYNTDLNYRLRVIIRNRLRTALKNNFKSGRTLELLGCSIDAFREYIESKWTDNMSWENHTTDGWHIDHIKPLDSFDLSDPEQLKLASHYTNMQPLWWSDNLKKRNQLK